MEEKRCYFVTSLAVGKPVEVSYHKNSVTTSIHKAPVIDAIYLSNVQLTGDEQGDKKHHGGPDKAVCAYCKDHYKHWEKVYEKKLHPHQFGENIMVEGLTEDIVNVGDIYAFGSAIIQVSQPRVPCFKLAIRTGWKEIVAKFHDTGMTGYYFRVLRPGKVAAGESLILQKKGKMSIASLNTIYYKKDPSREELESIIELEDLSEAYRKDICKLLAKLEGN